MQEDLLDLYLYYCLIGMGMTAPPLRAACIAMLSVPAVHAPKAVIGLLGKPSLGLPPLLPPSPMPTCLWLYRPFGGTERRHVVGGSGAAHCGVLRPAATHH